MATYLADVTLFDGVATKRRAGVLVAGDRIEWVGSHRRAPRAAGAEEVRLEGATLTPGLIDCHAHAGADRLPRPPLLRRRPGLRGGSPRHGGLRRDQVCR